MACASASSADNVVVDHNTPVVAPSIGISKLGPVVPAPPSYYGTNSSKYNTFIVGADGQVYSKAYSYRPIVRNTLRRLKKIGSYTLDEFDKKIIVNSVSSSNVTSHEATYVKVKTNNEITRTITPDYKIDNIHYVVQKLILIIYLMLMYHLQTLLLLRVQHLLQYYPLLQKNDV